MIFENASELLAYLRRHEIIICGVGNVALRFYRLLEEYEISNNVIAFARTKTEEELEIDGKKVISFDEMKESESVVACLAVHDINRSSMEMELKRYKIRNVVWIYPYLYQLFFGSPLQEQVALSVNKIVRVQSNYGVAIRSLAIDDYYGRNAKGFDIYLRAMQLSCEYETAKRRLNNFCRLIENWDKYGYDETKRIWIDDKYRVFDGMHRLSLAKYHNQREINCDIYEGRLKRNDWMGNNTLMEKEAVKCAFSEAELQLIEKTYQKLINGETYVTCKKYGSDRV